MGLGENREQSQDTSILSILMIVLVVMMSMLMLVIVVAADRQIKTQDTLVLREEIVCSANSCHGITDNTTLNKMGDRDGASMISRQ